MKALHFLLNIVEVLLLKILKPRKYQLIKNIFKNEVWQIGMD